MPLATIIEIHSRFQSTHRRVKSVRSGRPGLSRLRTVPLSKEWKHAPSLPDTRRRRPTRHWRLCFGRANFRRWPGKNAGRIDATPGRPALQFPIDVVFPGEHEPDDVDRWIADHAMPFHLGA